MELELTVEVAGNAAVQAVNRKRGYVERPAWVRLEAPLAAVEEAVERRV